MADDSVPATAPSSSSTTTTTTTTTLPPANCAQCAKTPATLKQCLKCHSVAYCNKECQKSNFKTHKKTCAGLAQAYNKTHEPKMAAKAPPRNDARDRGLQKWQFDT